VSIAPECELNNAPGAGVVEDLCDLGALVGSFAFGAGVLGLDHVAEILVLAACRFEIEDEIFDRETEMIEGFLEIADGLLHPLMARLCLGGERFELGTIGLGEGIDLLEELGEACLELVFFHLGSPFWICRGSCGRMDIRMHAPGQCLVPGLG
jgi:hypothetical protein